MEKKPDYGMYSLIASLVGLVIGLRIVGGILGIYFANEAEKNNQDLSMANAGKIIGIIEYCIRHTNYFNLYWIFCYIWICSIRKYILKGD